MHNPSCAKRVTSGAKRLRDLPVRTHGDQDVGHRVRPVLRVDLHTVAVPLTGDRHGQLHRDDETHPPFLRERVVMLAAP